MSPPAKREALLSKNISTRKGATIQYDRHPNILRSVPSPGPRSVATLDGNKEKEGTVSEDSLPGDVQQGESWFIPRSPTVLMDLPVTCRWEVTRRHPYYLRFWQLAHRHHKQPSDDPQQRDRERSAAQIILAIGLSGNPQPPGASAESLGTGSLSKGWESGAVAPVTFRGLAGLLLTGLPAEVRQQIGQLLVASGKPGDDEQRQKYDLLTSLSRLQHPVLDAFPNRPMVGVNIQAPQRVIVEAMEKLVRQWKEEQAIPERRRRDDKLEEYLAVWDRREGWAGDHYDGSQEQTLRQIARQLTVPISTVANRYRSAFRLITGRDYTPALWARVLGLLKLTEWVDPDYLPRHSGHRPWRSPQRQPVSETVLSAHGASEGPQRILNTAGVGEDEIAMVDLVLDIQQLLALGRSNEAIAAELDLSGPDVLAMVNFFRQRQEDAL